MHDIYFKKEYGKLYEKMESGICEIYEYSSELGSIYHMFVKRKIDLDIDGETWYDLITPYGYGGPIIMACHEKNTDNFVKEFENQFSNYCIENNVVSEFIRFHPLFDNYKMFEAMYDISYLRNTVGTNLKDYDDPFMEEFSKSCRKNIRRALRMGVDYRVIEKPSIEDIMKFKVIYYDTMNRNKASDFYYFNDEYFLNAIKNIYDNIILLQAIYEDKIIAEGMYLVYDKYIHIHLSGTYSEFLNLSPAYILRYGVTQWGKEKGYELIHHGGGITNNKEDSLFKFKKQFGKNTEFEFYVGKKIWNKEIYDKLCTNKNIDENSGFFPAYRKK